MDEKGQAALLKRYTIILPPGTLLFHGTLEEFPTKDVRGGPYDDVLWTALSPDIAQNYIPISGLTTYARAREIAYPSQDPVLQNLQKALGIEYDYSQVVYNKWGELESYPLPNGWSEWPESPDLTEIVIERMGKLGWEDGDYHTPYDLHIHNNEILMPGEKALGRLFIITVEEPLRIFDMTLGGEVEADISNVQYHNISLFRLAETKGFDGVKINDFAQSNKWGDTWHISIGLFNNALDKISLETVRATNYDWETYEDFDAKTTPEYEEWLGEQ